MRKRVNKFAITLMLALVMVVSALVVAQAEETVDTTPVAWEAYNAETLGTLEGAPSREGYLFAGWYKQACDGESTLEKDNYLKSAAIPDGATEIYAKFVPKSVLGINAMILAEDMNGVGESTSLRFVTTIDSLTYKSVGFNISYVKENVSVNIDTAEIEAYEPNLVYTKLRAMNAEGEITDEYVPNQTFSSVASVFKTVTLEQIGYTFCDVEVTVKPYWVTMDGTKVSGAAVTKKVSDGMTKLEDVYVASTGVDGKNAGTSESPLATMTHALNRTKDTATIHVLDDIEATATVRVREGKNITVQSAENADATIYRGSALSEESMFVANSGSILAINDITLDGRTETEAGDATEPTTSSTAASKPLLDNKGTVNLTNATVQYVNSTVTGAVLYMDSGTTSTINNSKFVKNMSTADGGAVYLALNDTGTVSTLTLTGTDPAMAVFDANKGNRGGAIFIKEGSDEYQGNKVIANGYTFKDNEATNASSGGGGAILDNGDDSSYENCIFENNSGYQGGAYRVHSGCTTPEFIKCTFKKNSATNNGGAIYAGAATTTTISGCTFGGETEDLGNTATNVGGAIYVNAGTTELTGSAENKVSFANNSGKRAGAIYINNGSIDAEYCQFNTNKATDAAHGGGAIYNKGNASSTITNCTFTGNNATGSGGAIYDIATAGTEIDNCTFDENDAESTENTAGGGAIYNANTTGATVIRNSTFTSNTAPSGSSNGYGGAVYTKVNMSITDTTFGGDDETDANVAKYGGAIYVNQGTLTLNGTNAARAIFKNNSGTVGGAIGLFGVSYTTSVDGNIIATGYSFISNSANSKGGGGAICNVGSMQSQYTDCIFESNENQSTSSGTMAGAVYDASTAGTTYTGCTFTSNSVNGNGGAVYDAATVDTTYTGCTFTSNSSASGYGGAIYIGVDKTVSLVGSNENKVRFEGNSAVRGGAIYINTGYIDADYCEFITNNATATNTNSSGYPYGGGAIFNNGTGSDIADSTFTGNTAYGGGAYNAWKSTCSPIFTRCTFTSNTATNKGNAVYAKNTSGQTTFNSCTIESTDVVNDSGEVVYN